MKFNNNMERMLHPQAKIIPLSLCASSNSSWNSDAIYRYFFAIEFPDEIISLIKIIQNNPDSLLVYIRENQISLKAMNNKVGLVIALTQTALDFSLVHQMLELLDISDALFFRMCGEAGNVELMKLFANSHPKTTWTQKIIQEDGYKIFRQAASYGHLNVLHYLAEETPDSLQEMIEEDNYYAFHRAIRYGHLDIVQYLIEQAPNKRQEMLNYTSIDEAVSSGNFSIFRYLAEQIPNKLRTLVSQRGYFIFCKAAALGDLPILQYLERQMPDDFQAMITANDYYAFRNAASNGHLEIVKYIAERAPKKLRIMISTNDYYAFRRAAASNHLHILHYLKEQAPDLINQMITSENYFSLIWAAAHNHDEVVYFLLSHPSGFAYAESHEQEFHVYTDPFIQQSLHDLRRKKTEYEENVISLTAKDAKQLFYLTRALIRRHAPQEDLRLILELPAVRELAHQAVTPAYPNELFRLAARLGNQEACEYLLTIPAVRREAEANNFYIDEYEGMIDLRLLAQDRESSMTALSQEENARLETLKNHYLEKDQRDPKKILEELRALLIKRYEDDPSEIFITDSNTETKHLVLPHAWDKFTALALSAKEKQAALEAYYKNKNHTAWRFLEKPNPWMHPHAPYTHRDASGQWSSFTNYVELIAILFLAAKDESTPGIDDYNIDDRVTHFIDELALIGRSHNWDKKNANQEEYDDLKGDKPSCYSGTKRRLFQSVQGHPLLKQLTLDLLQQELQQFVWHHFQETITTQNYQVLRRIWQKSIDMEMLSNEEKTTLSKINISKEDEARWIKALQKKYGDQLERYETFLLQKFNLSDQESHFIRFSYLGFDHLLKNFSEEDLSDPANSLKNLSPDTNNSQRFFALRSAQQNNNNISDTHTSDVSF